MLNYQTVLFETWKMVSFQFPNQVPEKIGRGLYDNFGLFRASRRCQLLRSGMCFEKCPLCNRDWRHQSAQAPHLEWWNQQLNIIGQLNPCGNACNMCLNRILVQGHGYCSMPIDPSIWKVLFEVLKTQKGMQEHLQILMVSSEHYSFKIGQPKIHCRWPFPC